MGEAKRKRVMAKAFEARVPDLAVQLMTDFTDSF
jgi:hypothetical protein